MDLEQPAHVYHPELIPRRGEFVAWGLGLTVLVVMLVVNFAGKPIPRGVPFLAGFFLLAGASISLGNWMDRRTSLWVESDGIRFTNGLRKVHMRWEDMRRVEVLTSNWGRKVRVLGEAAHFDFRTLGEVFLKGEVKGRMGFAEGDKILQIILEQARMKEVEHSGSNYYYARE